MYISLEMVLKGTALFILFGLFVVLLVYLIITLNNFNNLVKRVSKVVKNNNENLSKTLVVLPEVLKNANDVTVTLKQNVDKAGVAISTIEAAVSETVSTVSEGTENVLQIVDVAVNVVKIILGRFSRKD